MDEYWTGTNVLSAMFDPLLQYIKGFNFTALHNFVHVMVSNKLLIEKLKGSQEIQMVYVAKALNWIYLMSEQDEKGNESDEDSDEDDNILEVKKYRPKLGLVSREVMNEFFAKTKKKQPSKKRKRVFDSSNSDDDDEEMTRAKKISKRDSRDISSNTNAKKMPDTEKEEFELQKHQLWAKFLKYYNYVVEGKLKVLGAEQAHVVDLVMEGRNVFVTGTPGTGKSFLVKVIEKIKGPKLMIVAPTGMAACNVGGSTIHKAFNLAHPNISAFAQHRSTVDSDDLWSCETILVDEISMLGKSDFEKASHRAVVLFTTRRIYLEQHRLIKRGQNLDPEAQAAMLKEEISKGMAVPFCGKQVLLFGDFLQLPPVKDQYCFESPYWDKLDMTYVELKTNYRQSSDDQWRDFLQHVRMNKISDNMIRWINHRHLENNMMPDKLPVGVCRFNELPTDAIMKVRFMPRVKYQSILDSSVRITALNEEADQINKASLEKLNAREFTLNSYDTIFDKYKQKWIPLKDQKVKEAGLKTCKLLESLVIKEGARVIVNTNCSEKLVNGATGTVVKIRINSDKVDKCEEDEEEEDKRKKSKLKKKKRGKYEPNEDDYIQIKLDSDGSLCRVTRATWATSSKKDKKKKDEPQASTLDAWIQQQDVSKEKDPAMLLMMFDDFVNKAERQLGDSVSINRWAQNVPNGALMRQQFPLQLAYAISTHKSQGMTLESAVIKGSNSFAQGQLYVAFSRCKEYGKVFLIDKISRSNFIPNPKVNQFYSKNGLNKNNL